MAHSPKIPCSPSILGPFSVAFKGKEAVAVAGFGCYKNRKLLRVKNGGRGSDPPVTAELDDILLLINEQRRALESFLYL